MFIIFLLLLLNLIYLVYYLIWMKKLRILLNSWVNRASSLIIIRKLISYKEGPIPNMERRGLSRPQRNHQKESWTWWVVSEMAYCLFGIDYGMVGVVCGPFDIWTRATKPKMRRHFLEMIPILFLIYGCSSFDKP